LSDLLNPSSGWSLMARRKSGGSHVYTSIGKVRGCEGDKAIIVRGEKHTRVAQIGPDRTVVPTTEELVDSEDIFDVRHIHDVSTGQRRVVVLPSDLCRRLGIHEGTSPRIIEHESHFEVIPMRLVPATEDASPSLESLLAGVTPENIHGEFDTGPAVGQEAW
jgi:antitoxin component of MazEF toxin-antitoxin module